MVILKQERSFYRISALIPLEMRWLMAIAFFSIEISSFAQRSNVWLLETYPAFNDHADSTYTMDFNYCPAQIKKIFIEKDINLRKTHIQQHPTYTPVFLNSFCDTVGTLAFTELLGQHYYNKYGKLYDSTYINNSYFKYANNHRGVFIATKDKTYYFKVYGKISTELKSTFHAVADSIIVCVSEFENDGKLISKNKFVYKELSKIPLYQSIPFTKIIGKKLDEQNAQIILLTNPVNHIVFNYNFISGVVTPQKSINIDSVDLFKLSNTGYKLAANNNFSLKTLLCERDVNNNYQAVHTIDFTLFPTPQKGHKCVAVYDYCFSPNDSILYASAFYQKDTIAPNQSPDSYVIAINYSKFYNEYKFFKIRDKYDYLIGNNHANYYLKLGPDGNIYIGSKGRVNSKYRLIHPNSIGRLKLEKLPEIKTAKFPDQATYGLYISTLEDYKRVEFIFQQTCKGLGALFTNLSDTQFFRSYRLFYGNGDSITLTKDWNKYIYTYPKTGKYFVKLKAFSKIGGFIWYGDSIEVFTPPVADFNIQKTKGCQWIGYGFTDSSKWFGIKQGFSPWKRWFFGDGKDSIDAGKNPNLTYIYSKSDTFTVKLVISNGYCTDTAVRINTVLILPAPQPGIVAGPVQGCTPLKVVFKYKYIDILDSAVWNSGEIPVQKFIGTSGNFTYPLTGDFWLTQKLYGPSGCMTRDSVKVKVIPGINGMPDILNATVTNDTIKLLWKKHPNAVEYSIIKNNRYLTRTVDTSYCDVKANILMPNTYNIKAISLCNDSTVTQDLAQTIYLKGERTDKSEAKLTWTAYQRWDLGVNSYKLYSQSYDGGFSFMANISGQILDFTDKTFAGISEPQRCYKIVADENLGNLQLSVSNIICVPLKPTLLIPSAFSPNGDGINDTWFISYQGIKEANIRIFNRWGELIYRSTAEKPEWDAIYKGLEVPTGAYFYQIEAIGIKHEKVFKHGLVEVIR
jgi:gliding motility-associated-like protein